MASLTRAWMVSAALAALGLGLGTALDEVPARSAVMRGGFRVLEADFHAHTRFADGLLSPFDLVLQARRKGLDALAITEHNIIFPGQMARWFSRATGGPDILVGEEITTNHYHVHGIGLTERINASAPLHEVIAAIHRQGGVVVAAHPVRRFWPYFQPELAGIDATEVMHPLAYGSGRDWRWEDLRDFYEEARASGHPLTAIGASDYHFGSPLGVCRTLIFARGEGEGAVLDALRAGRTVVHDLEGHAYGDPEMIRLLTQDPVPPRPIDYGYHPSGFLDRAARSLGWLGVLGMALFRRRRAA